MVCIKGDKQVVCNGFDWVKKGACCFIFLN
jgi:hypothetical protein